MSASASLLTFSKGMPLKSITALPSNRLERALPHAPQRVASAGFSSRWMTCAAFVFFGSSSRERR
jgi:hypothetical protein